MKHKIICMMFLTASALTHAASFDCTEAATIIEKQICADDQLSALDSQLLQSYKDSRINSANADALKSEQRTWLVTVRNRCEDAECLRQAYTDRIAHLGGIHVAAAPPVQNPTSSSDTAAIASQNSSSILSHPIEATPLAVTSVGSAPKVTDEASPNTDKQSSSKRGIEGYIGFIFVVVLLYLVGARSLPRQGNWFVLRKIKERDLHGRQVHNDLILCDTEKELLAQSKSVMNEMECPKCGNHKLKGNVTVHYGQVKLFKEIKTANGYANELVSKKWLYYGPSMQSGEHVKCPDCNWQMKSGRFEDFGSKAAMVIAASIAAHKMFSKTSR